MELFTQYTSIHEGEHPVDQHLRSLDGPTATTKFPVEIDNAAIAGHGDYLVTTVSTVTPRRWTTYKGISFIHTKPMWIFALPWS